MDFLLSLPVIPPTNWDHNPPTHWWKEETSVSISNMISHGANVKRQAGEANT